MAIVNLTVTMNARPAYYALLDCAREIALTHGEDAAVEWAQAALGRDVGMFIKTGMDRRPALRLIQGGG